ncbi:MAG: hypothetical protein OXU79_00130 [Gemmatimonadota bacterium]|nr:hypothetical protein [Gemmatimonadota bacterium]
MGDLLEKEIVFRLHMYEDEELIDLVEEYTLTALGDIPKAGDYIISPWVLPSLDRKDPKNRTIYEVVSRYFLPRNENEEEDWVYVALVVKERAMNKVESTLIATSP